MTKLILTICVMYSLVIGLQVAPVKNLQISVDNQLVTFTAAPIFKDGAWLVPLIFFCKQLGLKVESPEGDKMVVICSDEETDLCVPLHFDEKAFNIEGVIYASPENIAEPFGFEIYKASETELEVVRPEQLAPKFTLPNLNDTPRRLQDFRGKKTLLYIWGSW